MGREEQENRLQKGWEQPLGALSTTLGGSSSCCSGADRAVARSRGVSGRGEVPPRLDLRRGCLVRRCSQAGGVEAGSWTRGLGDAFRVKVTEGVG